MLPRRSREWRTILECGIQFDPRRAQSRVQASNGKVSQHTAARSGDMVMTLFDRGGAIVHDCGAGGII